ncbi:MAG: DegT/DnrJ/EryC1/StrS aminotransferase family protein [Bacteroidales bacterium]|nr:DegT/DnrJ/EryC1/StrS aminotransferase family protein [Bacteroidales bacterium]
MIPFSPPRVDEKNITEVVKVLQSGWITTGPRTKEFEHLIADFCGINNVLCVNSASSGLELMLRWFGVQDGDEVIVPAYTYAATANVVVHCGAKVVFVDCNSSDFNINIKEIEKHITENTKVIMPVDIGGFPCDYDAINQLVAREDIKHLFRPVTDIQQQLGRILVLSDAAHSIGATYKGRHTGSLTDASVFSFHAVKNLTTAEGGAICLNLPKPFDNAEIYKCLNFKSLHGQTKDAFSKMQKGNWEYDIVEAGYKYNMTDIMAAIGIVELNRYQDDMLVKRKHIFDAYAQFFSQYAWAEVPLYEEENRCTSYHVFLLRIKNINEQQRNAVIQEIFEQDVAVNVHFKPLPMMSFYKKLGYKIEDYPTAYQNYSQEISLPVYYSLSDRDIQQVCSAVKKAVEKIVSY